MRDRYELPRNNYRSPLVEFWRRYYYNFKELTLNPFYFPTFFACFGNP
ncbi:MAG: hypothetical protein JO234_07320 [Hyphomicrobiales bacterium]|nr:hypothetical protein [Hyphomicrobiales bacterium]